MRLPAALCAGEDLFSPVSSCSLALSHFPQFAWEVAGFFRHFEQILLLYLSLIRGNLVQRERKREPGWARPTLASPRFISGRGICVWDVLIKFCNHSQPVKDEVLQLGGLSVESRGVVLWRHPNFYPLIHEPDSKTQRHAEGRLDIISGLLFCPITR